MFLERDCIRQKEEEKFPCSSCLTLSSFKNGGDWRVNEDEIQAIETLLKKFKSNNFKAPSMTQQLLILHDKLKANTKWES